VEKEQESLNTTPDSQEANLTANKESPDDLGRRNFAVKTAVGLASVTAAVLMSGAQSAHADVKSKIVNRLQQELESERLKPGPPVAFFGTYIKS
jgi:hypothetical protein